MESCIIIWSVCWLLLVFLGAAAAFLFHWPGLAFVARPIFVVSQAVAIILAFRFRCPARYQRLLVQGFRTLHPAGKTWIALTFDIARHREFTCMHCGETRTVAA